MLGANHRVLSRCPLGITGLSWPGIKVYILKKSSAAKFLEQITEFLVSAHLACFNFTKSTHFFLRFLACGRSSFANGIKWRAKPSFRFGVLPQPPTTHLFGIFKLFPALTQTLSLCLHQTNASEFLGRRHTIVTSQLDPGSFKRSVVKILAQFIGTLTTRRKVRIYAKRKIFSQKYSKI